MNAIESNIQQRLNGCDYDSDSMLVPDDKLIIAGVTGCYDILKVPVCKAEPVGKTDYENTPKSLAALDQTIAKNKIGEIVNLSQFLNCLLWDGLFSEKQGAHHPMDIYHDICILAVLSGMEIDKAKRLYSVDSGKVLSRLRHYRQDYKKNHGGNLPAFYKYIVGDESPMRVRTTLTLKRLWLSFTMRRMPLPAEQPTQGRFPCPSCLSLIPQTQVRTIRTKSKIS